MTVSLLKEHFIVAGALLQISETSQDDHCYVLRHNVTHMSRIFTLHAQNSTTYAPSVTRGELILPIIYAMQQNIIACGLSSYSGMSHGLCKGPGL